MTKNATMPLDPSLSPSVRHFFTGLAALTRRIRADDDLSQVAVARRGGISPRLVTDVEHERANPTTIHLDKLAHGLGLDGVAELVTLAYAAAERLTANTARPTD